MVADSQMLPLTNYQNDVVDRTDIRFMKSLNEPDRLWH